MQDGEQTPEQSAAQASAHAPEQAGQAPGGVQKAPLNKMWLLKIGVITLVLLGFGAWGLLDAVSIYPARGAKYATFREMQYLDALQAADAQEEIGIFLSRASVEDPESEMASLTDPETLERLQQNSADPNSTQNRRATARLARLEWLKALQTIGAMVPEQTTIADPTARLAELKQQWAAEDPPKALAFYDIPSQWAICIAAWSIAAVLLVLILRTMLKTYTWDAAAMRLTIPGGGAFGPDDLAVFDKRKWDKFIVFIRLNEGHTLGTDEIKFDTYRHAKLEDWLVEMGKAAGLLAEEEDEAALTDGAEEAAEDAAGGDSVGVEGVREDAEDDTRQPNDPPAGG